MIRFYHYRVPNESLDFGLHALGSDSDVLGFCKYTVDHKTMHVYTEFGVTNVHTYFCTPTERRIEEVVVDNLPPSRLMLGWQPIANDVGQSSAHQEHIVIGQGQEDEHEEVLNANELRNGVDQSSAHQEQTDIGQGHEDRQFFAKFLNQALNDDFDPFFGIDSDNDQIMHDIQDDTIHQNQDQTMYENEDQTMLENPTIIDDAWYEISGFHEKVSMREGESSDESDEEDDIEEGHDNENSEVHGNDTIQENVNGGNADQDAQEEEEEEDSDFDGYEHCIKRKDDVEVDMRDFRFNIDVEVEDNVDEHFAHHMLGM
ncbi:hypothetical protein QVD17_10385 [Tagetes erecta]|uniref:Uncharacterized protein n=1 Tax=Tagetes erecta TaxID=13708 RepID=A0AAD8L0Z6_TARER|nr:hypothetical protein QVD17_10385 [Tagetes erecta]